MSNNQLPDVLNVKPLPSIQTMNVDTNILDPIVVNQSLARFVLEKKGILDVGSSFTFSLVCDAGAVDKCFLPIRTGVHSVVKRAILRIGTKIIATSDDYPYYQTMKRMFKTNEERFQKDSVKHGTADVVQPDNQGTGFYQLKSAVYSDATTALADPALRITNSELECPIFQIKISELFPMMRNIQLPLYLINEPVSIEISFNQQPNGTSGVLANFESGYANSTAVTIGLSNVKFLADYLTYEDERMDATAKLVMSENGLVMPYEDLVLTSANIPASNPAPAGDSVIIQNITRDLGLSGRNVRSILCHDHKNGNNALAGQYSSDAYNVADEYNFRINDKLVYSRNVVNEARKQDQLSQVFGTNINVSVPEYSLDALTNKQVGNQPVNNQVFSNNTYYGNSNRTLNGTAHFEGVDLTTSPLNVTGSGQLVGQKPVESIKVIKRTAQNNDSRELRYFSLVERMMSIKNGQVFVSA